MESPPVLPVLNNIEAQEVGWNYLYHSKLRVNRLNFGQVLIVKF